MKRAVLLIAIAACGDNGEQIDIFEPTNGTRLAIEQYQFDDGTRLVQPSAFYDRRIHARCTPQKFLDGVIRCVPDAEQAFYREDDCLTLFGVARQIKFPTHFIAYETAENEQRPARVITAGAKIEPITAAYMRDGDTCTGPFEPFIDETTVFYDFSGEVGGQDLVPITDTEIGDGRLQLSVRKADDGALVPLGFRDRDLALPCVPGPRGDSGVCEPVGAVTAGYFADTECIQPAVLTFEETAPPLASTRLPDGCLAYHAITGEVPRVYRRQGTACLATPTSLHAFAAGPAIDLIPVDRTPEDAPARRIRRILASDGGLHVYADRLYDTATRAECHLARLGDTLRCVPTALAPIVRAFQPGCTIELRLAEIPAQSCEPIGFASNDTGETLELHAVGDRFDGTAYTFGPGGGCVPYTPAPDTQLYSVGPLLPEATFSGAVPFGAR